MSTRPISTLPSKKMLSPNESLLLLIDHQPQMAFATKSISIENLINNVTGLAKAAKIFDIPTILTTVARNTFAGPIFPSIQAVFPATEVIDRTNTNAWEDENVVEAIKQTGRKKLIIAALWTEVCLVGPVLSALEQGFEVYIVSDASGGVSNEAHNMAMARLIQAGAQPLTWLAVLVELQRDWARKDTYDAVSALAKEHGGAYGIGIIYAHAMFNASEAVLVS
jgi:nicotinamidase-related amidase